MGRIKIALKKVPGLMWGSLIIVLLFAIFAKNFINPRNIENIFKNTSILAIISIGVTMAILSQKIDLSVGGIMTFSGTMAAVYIQPLSDNTTAIDVVIACLIGIAVGTAFGAFNGLMIGKFNFNYWLITFSTMSIGYGLSQAVTKGETISGYSEVFRNTFAGDLILGIPNLIIIAVVIIGIMMFVLKRTRFGMHIYAVGDSEQCAHQSGISVKKVRFWIYVISGALAGLSGVMLIAKTNSASATSGTGYEFDAIAAVIVGGTSFDGGKGSLAGTALGAIIIAAVKSGLQLIGFNPYWQKTLIGVFILAIIVIDVLSERRRKLASMRRVYK